ncbi:MAG: tRNA lysidine(34) synthetase TilS [Bacteroidaceae bacterium]|nr:tRNA lysidine(34) synthetase TilS [Bacteroidaceae bacterium]
MAVSFKDKVRDYILCNNLLEDGSTVLAGVSGGADSTALLLVLLQLGYRIHAVHCNFHLRGAESDRDQQFITEFCKKLGVELTVCSYDTRRYASDHSISIEMAARELRYADFERIMKETGASAVCIAHHRDDSVETVLLNLIRGTGLKGLTGIKPRNGHIIRPLLCVSRQEIEEWLHEIGQPYVTDSTNLETDYTRNKIRLELLPIMRTVNPSADSSIESTALHLQQAYAFYSNAIEQARQETVSECDGNLTIDIGKLRQSPSVQGLLFEILSPLGFNDAQITDIASSLDSQPGTRFCSATHQIVKDRNVFTVSPLDSNRFEPLTVSIEPGTSIPLPDGSRLTVSTAPAGTPISKDPSVATFDADLIKGPIQIRTWQDGDWFIPFGMKGRKLVSNYLTDCKVSAADRRRQLVVTCAGDIIWLLGRRTDNRFRVTPHTTTQLKLRIENEPLGTVLFVTL